MNIIKYVLKDMPQGLDDLGKARYIYLKLGLMFNFNTSYQNTTDARQSLIFTNYKVDIKHLTSNQVICTLWSLIYSNILSYIGIENEIVNNGHKHVRFKYNNKWWIADAADQDCYSDLSRIRYGDKTISFGVALYQDRKDIIGINYEDPDMNKLSGIDKKIPFYQANIQQFESLNKELSILNGSTKSTNEKVDFMFYTLGKLGNGYYETKDFVRQLEKSYLTQEDLNKIHAVELKRTNRKYDVDIVQCIYVFENGSYSYYLLAPNLPIRKVSLSEIKYLANLGYGIEKQIPEVDYPKKFKRGERISPFYKLTRYGLSSQRSFLCYDVRQNRKPR